MGSSPIDVVADFGFDHGAAHLGRGLGDGIAAQIDHVVEELLEDFVGEQDAAVGEAQHAVLGFEQAGVEEAADGCVEAAPLVGRRGGRRRRGGGRRRGARRRGAVSSGTARRRRGSRRAIRDSGGGTRPSKEWASAPKPTYGSSFQYFRLWRDSQPGRAKLEIS